MDVLHIGCTAEESNFTQPIPFYLPNSLNLSPFLSFPLSKFNNLF